jgi:quinol monooxygenase YgiN
MDARMIILAGSIRVPVDKLDAARPVLETIVTATRAEPGCVAYSFSFDVMDKGLVRIFEIFANEEALAAHRASPHMAAWRAAWPELGIGERNMSEYDVSNFRKI